VSDTQSAASAFSSHRIVRRHAGHRVVREAGAAGVKLPVVHVGGNDQPVQTVHSANEDAARSRRRARIASQLFSDPGVDEPVAKPSFPAPSAPLFQAPHLPEATEDQESQKDSTSTPAGEEGTSRRRHRSRSHSSRRLNAQERAAAAEVGHIEDDLAREAAASQDHEEDSSKKADTEDEARLRRRRELDEELQSGHLPSSYRRSRRHSRRSSADDYDEEISADESDRAEDRRSSARGHVQSLTLASSYDEDEEESPRSSRSHEGLRRRVRTRPSRSRSEEEIEAAPSVTSKEREKAYISQIKDVKGSTRLEAKRRRRREGRRTHSHQTFMIDQDYLAQRDNVDRQMIVREKGRHTQISVIEDNILVEHYVSDIDEVSTVGNIYLGRVQNVLPSMEAAFVNIGEPRNGVLYAGEVNWDSTRLEGQSRRIELAYHSGDPILVQVTKDPIGHKGARLTSQVTLAGRYIVLVPSGAMTGVSRKLPERERTRLKQIVQSITPQNMGVIIRTAAQGASREAVVDDLNKLIERWKAIQARYNELKDTHRSHILHSEPDVAIRVVRDIFNDDFRQLVVEGQSVYQRIHDYLQEMSPELLDRLHYWDPAEHHGEDVFDQWHIDGQLRKGMEREVYLPSGGSLVIDRTEAMTTIDVNTGRFIGKGRSLEETVTRCNLEAAEEIVRQLRLRDIGGMIMIDFVDMVMEENRDLVLKRLVECLSRDRTKHQVAEVTSLGLVQMTRKRVGQGLVEAFSEECPTCHGRGFIIHDEPTIDAGARDPYEVKGGDPFEKSKGRRELEKRQEEEHREETQTSVPHPSSDAVKAKLAQIAAAATRTDEEQKAQKAHKEK
jgi:ribonuclease E